MAINANFYNFNGIDNGSDLIIPAATDLNSDSFYDLTLPAGQGSGSGWFRVEFDSPVDLSSFIAGSYDHSFNNVVSVNGNYDSVSDLLSTFQPSGIWRRVSAFISISTVLMMKMETLLMGTLMIMAILDRMQASQHWIIEYIWQEGFSMISRRRS